MCVPSSSWSSGCFYCHFPFSGYPHHVHNRSFCSLERLSMDSGCIPCSALRCHVLYARDSILAVVQKSWRRSSKVPAVLAWKVCPTFDLINKRKNIADDWQVIIILFHLTDTPTSTQNLRDSRQIWQKEPIRRASNPENCLRDLLSNRCSSLWLWCFCNSSVASIPSSISLCSSSRRPAALWTRTWALLYVPFNPSV